MQCRLYKEKNSSHFALNELEKGDEEMFVNLDIFSELNKVAAFKVRVGQREVVFVHKGYKEIRDFDRDDFI